MRAKIIKDLECPVCGATTFKMESVPGLYDEYRNGGILCRGCGKNFLLDDGIVDFLIEPSPEIIREREVSSHEARINTGRGEKLHINPETISKFSNAFKSLPRGDGSYLFREGGSFQNFAEGSHRFYELVNTWGLKPGTKVLELGAGFCWASREFAQRGCDVVAVDITDYLKVADLYLKDGLYFERIYADMNKLPFSKDSFDIIFAAAAVHHSSDLSSTFNELYRVAKPGGKLILLNECFIGSFEKPQQHSEDFGYNDHYYTIRQWMGAIKKSGFNKVRFDFLSFLKDYAARKRIRGVEKGLKLRLIELIINIPVLDKFVSTAALPYRIFFRPRSVLIEAIK